MSDNGIVALVDSGGLHVFYSAQAGGKGIPLKGKAGRLIASVVEKCGASRVVWMTDSVGKWLAFPHATAVARVSVLVVAIGSLVAWEMPSPDSVDDERLVIR